MMVPGDQLEGLSRLAAERGDRLNKEDLAVLSYLKGDSDKRYSDKSFKTSSDAEEQARDQDEADGLDGLAFIAGPIGLSPTRVGKVGSARGVARVRHAAPRAHRERGLAEPEDDS